MLFSLYNGGVGRFAQAIEWEGDAGSVAKKSAECFLPVLKIAESNAELWGLEIGSLVIEHIQVNKA